MEIQVLSKKTEKHLNWTVDEYITVPPIELKDFNAYLGIDPGTVNLGMSWMCADDIGRDRAKLWQIKITRSDDPVQRIMDINAVLNELIASGWNNGKVTIENAAYAQGFRQVELAEQRAAIISNFLNNSAYSIQMAAPMTIRKKVFGSGKIKAHEVWQLEGISKTKQPNDALAALSCAYYGAMA